MFARDGRPDVTISDIMTAVGVALNGRPLRDVRERDTWHRGRAWRAAAGGDAVLLNNTLYANDGWGIAIGFPGTPSTGTVVRDNILQLNQRGGIADPSRSAA